MIFPDLYEELGVTYRYLFADIIVEYKNAAVSFFKKNEISEAVFFQKTINFFILENEAMRREYDLHYFNFNQIEDNELNVEQKSFTEAEQEKFVQRLNEWKNDLQVKAKSFINGGFEAIHHYLKWRYRKLMMTTKNMVVFALSTTLILITFYLFVCDLINQQSGKPIQSPFLIYSYMLLIGFGGYCNIWYSVYF